MDTPAPNQQVSQPPQPQSTSPAPTQTPAVVPGDPFYRIWASVVDGFYIGIVSVACSILFLRSGYAPLIFEYGGSVVYFIYVILMTVIRGATYGKDAYGMTVVTYGTQNKISYGQSVLREVVKTGIAYIPYIGAIFFVVNTCVVIFSKDKRGLHDKVAKTQVIHVKSSWPLKKQLLLIGVPFVILILLSLYFYSQQEILPPPPHHK